MKKNKLALCAAALLLCSSCTAGNRQISSVSPEEQLANSVFAYAMSTDFRSAGGEAGKPGGSIVFYNPDSKKWTDIATHGMEGASLDYNGETLYFTDYQTDYALNRSSMTTVPHPEDKAAYMALLFALPADQGGGMVGLSNVGFTDDFTGYRYDVVVTRGGERVVHPLNYNFGFAAQCEDGSVWGWTDPYLSGNNRDYGPTNPPQGILQIYPDFKPEPVATIEHDRRYKTGNSLNCSEGVLYYIIDTYHEGIKDPYGGGLDDYDGTRLVSYDTKTGRFEVKEITGDWAVRSSEEMWLREFMPKYIYNGHLYWISGTGDVVKTDLKTAHNTIVFKLEGVELPREDTGLMDFQGQYMFQSVNRVGENIHFYRYNLETERLESHVEIPDYTEVEKPLQAPVAMVVTDLEKALAL